MLDYASALLIEFAIYFIIGVVRFAGYGIHPIFFKNKLATGLGQNEILRIGTDLSLMGLGLFLGSMANNLLHGIANNIIMLYITLFLVLYFVNYTIFLGLIGKRLNLVFQEKGSRILFIITIIVGIISLYSALQLPHLNVATKLK